MTNNNNNTKLQEKQLNRLCQMVADNSGKSGCKETARLAVKELEDICSTASSFRRLELAVLRYLGRVTNGNR